VDLAAVLAAPVALWLVVGVRGPAHSHTTATGIAVVTAEGAEVRYRLTLVLAELPATAARDLAAAGDGDGAAVERVVAALREKVRVKADDAACRSGRALLSGSRLGDTRLTLEIEFHCPRAPGRLAIATTGSISSVSTTERSPGSTAPPACARWCFSPTRATRASISARRLSRTTAGSSG
jgi:hypothetical protein